MKTKLYASAIFFLILGLLLSGCGAGIGNPFQPTPTFTPTPTPRPTRIPPDQIVIIQKGAEMMRIPTGSFMMGSDQHEEEERPAHSVTISAFYMDKYEVTNALYSACVAEGACTPPEEWSSYTRKKYYGYPEFNNFPVIKVDWKQANNYCLWRGARLPTEAQWEYAARGTDGREYPWGNANPSADSFKGNDTSPVGINKKDQSPFGVYDMAANVAEWVNDWFDYYYYAVSPSYNPAGPATSQFADLGKPERVYRGGHYNSYGSEMLSFRRYWSKSTYTEFSTGFRCALPLD